jgi:hypothetical protein
MNDDQSTPRPDAPIIVGLLCVERLHDGTAIRGGIALTIGEFTWHYEPTDIGDGVYELTEVRK